jgi:dTDP-4-amino-4,6-dideoxygalactose transaminase
MLRTHGITRDSSRFAALAPDSTQAPGGWYYEQQLLGFNYRLTEIHAALGISQLARLQHNVARRNELADRYQRAFSGMPLQLPAVQANNRSAYHLYVVRLSKGTAPARHCAVFEDLRRRGINVNLHYQPVHLQPYYRRLGFEPGQYPQAEAHGTVAITLPLFATLSEGEQDRVVAAVTKSLGT